MAHTSKAPDGDRQGDGWGVAWLNEENQWQVKKSLSPVWQETEIFETFPQTSLLVAHARSASFSHHKGVIEFNQPYISENYAFVFNGMLRGVTLSNFPGKIGAEKIWYLLQRKLAQNDPPAALEKVKQILMHHSREIVALNIGLATTGNMYALNYFTRNPEYYILHRWKTEHVEIICSEKL